VGRESGSTPTYGVRDWGSLTPHMPHPRAPLDGGGLQPVDLQLLTDLFQHAELDLGVSPVRGDHVAGQRIGGLVEALGQGLADQAEGGGGAVFLLDQVTHDAADAGRARGIDLRE
jgi:hypothetical protein